ncbi:MAG TPA: carbonic anhydrase [Terriglobales bacterium]|nr:carbonic anhydrase [Terriglobales bacterium]
MKSQDALAKIVAGVGKFQRDLFPERRQFFGRLRQRQQPIAMFLTCADSRIVPNLLMQTEPGEVFIERTVGNIVPRYSDHVGGVTAGVEFAVLALHVPLMIVCGHTDCGVMKALLQPENASGMPALQSWMRHALPARERLLRDNPAANGDEKLRLLTQYNVLMQLENLKTHPAVEAALARGELALQGWVYDIADGEVLAADSATGDFHALSGAAAKV